MQHKYSKSSGDINGEGVGLIDQERALQKIISEVTALLPNYPERKSCIVCEVTLDKADIFQHRDIAFKHCGQCGHIQTHYHADDAYEAIATKALGYEGIYPELDQVAYDSRCARIYKPKAEWIWENLVEQSIDPKNLKWCDIGCGAGYFLKSLQDMGCAQIQGVDIDEHNLKIAQQVMGDDIVRTNPYSFDETFTNIQADIYTAFFVLEHIEGVSKTIAALKSKPRGTFFAFSVPVFGFIALFESIVKDHYPRSLDAMMHTQIYTEESIAYFLEQAGYDVVGEWVFGQDMMDIHRFISTNLSQRYPEKLYQQSMEKVSALIDPMQNKIDEAHFADARHILAVKK